MKLNQITDTLFKHPNAFAKSKYMKLIKIRSIIMKNRKKYKLFFNIDLLKPVKFDEFYQDLICTKVALILTSNKKNQMICW
jgi:hypothetical protein